MTDSRRGALCVMVLLLATLGLVGPAAAEEGCKCKDLVVRCRLVPSPTVLIGDEFCIEAEVENVNELPLEDVTLTIRGCPRHARPVDPNSLERTFPRIDPGQKQTMRVCFKAIATGECQVTAHAKDRDWFTASGCACTATIEGLPALQLEMVDVDRSGAPKGIFEIGEEFQYVCRVQNDAGTTLTPDLLVTWELPPELEFVSGTGTGGVTVTGQGTRCESSVFVLAPPDGTQDFSIRVRVIGVPQRNLVQSRATVTTVGGQVLALETESTTLKGNGR